MNSPGCAKNITASTQDEFDAAVAKDAIPCDPTEFTIYLENPSGNITVDYDYPFQAIKVTGASADLGTLDLTKLINGVPTLEISGENGVFTMLIPSAAMYSILLDNVGAVIMGGGAQSSSGWTIRNAPMFSAYNVTSLSDLIIEGGDMSSSATFLALKSIANNLTLSNDRAGLDADQLSRVAGNANFIDTPSVPAMASNLTVEGMLNIQGTSAEPNASVVEDAFDWPATSIGSDLVIGGLSSKTVRFPSLSAIDGDVRVENNTGACHFDFSSTTSIGDLTMRANSPDTALPGDWRLLEFAETVYLNGHIDSSLGANLFPSLKSVAVSMTVEPWDDSFDCSTLVTQAEQGIISHLYCNGTNSGNDTQSANPAVSSSPAPSSGNSTGSSGSSSGLSTGAWAGIGVAIGIVVLGLVGGLIWMLLHFRRKSAQLEKEAAVRGDGSNSNNSEDMRAYLDGAQRPTPNDNQRNGSYGNEGQYFGTTDSAGGSTQYQTPMELGSERPPVETDGVPKPIQQMDADKGPAEAPGWERWVAEADSRARPAEMGG